MDVADPAHPVEVGSCDTPMNALGVTTAGDYVYMADDQGGLWILQFDKDAQVTR